MEKKEKKKDEEEKDKEEKKDKDKGGSTRLCSHGGSIMAEINPPFLCQILTSSIQTPWRPRSEKEERSEVL